MINRNNIGMILFLTACVMAICYVFIFKDTSCGIYIRRLASILGLAGYLLIPGTVKKRSEIT
ncbi:hypothetical protein [Bacillus sp. V2I10]|uniref:hypothetical protein n=1 Tax=Bacillus sp. V2I10 TaxID=3042276 RepID=UPI002783181B|nr:hypothetical protein [Bacillus sp. V2I10]MDQ0856648.1 hypothetical protein [Bacillus sp. V2I10]